MDRINTTIMTSCSTNTTSNVHKRDTISIFEDDKHTSDIDVIQMTIEQKIELFKTSGSKLIDCVRSIKRHQLNNIRYQVELNKTPTTLVQHTRSYRLSRIIGAISETGIYCHELCKYLSSIKNNQLMKNFDSNVLNYKNPNHQMSFLKKIYHITNIIHENSKPNEINQSDGKTLEVLISELHVLVDLNLECLAYFILNLEQFLVDNTHQTLPSSLNLEHLMKIESYLPMRYPQEHQNAKTRFLSSNPNLFERS